MSHLDPEEIALLALGETDSLDSAELHLAECAVCAAELDEMKHAVGVGRSTIDGVELEAPPAAVWGRISDELGLAPVESVEPAAEVPDIVQAPARRSRTWRRTMWALAASSALVLAGGGAWLAGRFTAPPVAIAAAALDAFPAHPTASGGAEVREGRDGERTLVVTLDADDAEAGYREVWLIRNDGEALMSLGVLEGADATFPIPSGVDLSSYDLVDISVEPLDGDPAHSGDSIVRGQLEFT